MKLVRRRSVAVARASGFGAKHRARKRFTAGATSRALGSGGWEFVCSRCGGLSRGREKERGRTGNLESGEKGGGGREGTMKRRKDGNEAEREKERKNERTKQRKKHERTNKSKREHSRARDRYYAKRVFQSLRFSLRTATHLCQVPHLWRCMLRRVRERPRDCSYHSKHNSRETHQRRLRLKLSPRSLARRHFHDNTP